MAKPKVEKEAPRTLLSRVTELEAENAQLKKAVSEQQRALSRLNAGLLEVRREVKQ